MTFQERNTMMAVLIKKYETVHSLYTSSANQLTDEQWESYIKQMEDITAKYKDTNVYDFAGAIQMCFLNDTEYIQKRLKKYEMRT